MTEKILSEGGQRIQTVKKEGSDELIKKVKNEGIDLQRFLQGCTPQQEEYLCQRWGNEIAWFAERTRKSRQLHFAISWVPILVGALTACFATIGVAADYPVFRYATAIFGLLTAVTTGIAGLYRPEESWVRRSMTLERLKYEGRMLNLSAGPYRGVERELAFKQFAEAIERIVSEHKNVVFRELSGSEASSPLDADLEGSHAKMATDLPPMAVPLPHAEASRDAGGVRPAQDQPSLSVVPHITPGQTAKASGESPITEIATK